MTAAGLRDLLLKYWLLIVVCMGFGIIGGIGGTLVQHPQYQSSVLMRALVSPAASDAYAQLVEDRLIGTEAQLALSTPVLDGVVSRIPGVTADQLRTHVTVTPEPNTQLFQITVTSTDATQAAAIANAFGAELVAQQASISRQMLAQDEQATITAMSAAEADITKITAQLQTDTTLSAATQATLQAQLDGDKANYARLSGALAGILQQAGLQNILLTIASPARPSAAPIRPVLSLNIYLGALGGGLFGVLAVLVGGSLDQQVRGSTEVSALMGCPVLAELTLPSVTSEDASAAFQATLNNGTAVGSLHNGFTFLGLERPLRRVAVTSASRSAHVNSVTASLAVALAAGRQRVIAIDASWTTPSLADVLDCVAEPGLGDALLTSKQGTSLPMFWKSAARVASLPLKVVPSGTRPPNPGKLLLTTSTQEVLDRLAAPDAQHVLITCGDVHDTPEVAAFSAHCDGVLVVVEPEREGRTRLLHLRRVLDEAGAPVIGCILVHRTRARKGRERRAEVSDSTMNRSMSAYPEQVPALSQQASDRHQ